jgi:hypothetical protein
VNRRAIDWPAIVAVTVALALGVFAMNPLPIGVFHDDARYLLLARSIAEGTGYRFVFVPGAPAGTHFPPAFPLVLAALWKIAPAFPANVALFKLLNAVMLALAAFAAFLFARGRAGLAPWVATGVAIAFAGSVPEIFIDSVLFSEPFFIASMLCSLILSEHLVQASERGEHTGRQLAMLAFAAGAGIGAVTMVRTIGLALAVGIAITLVRRRRWREFAFAMAGISLFVVPWQWWTMRHGGEIPGILSGDYGTYVNWLKVALRSEGNGFELRVVEANLRGLGIPLALFGVGDASSPVAFLVAAPLLVALAAGVARLARRAPVTVATTAAYLFVVLIWPYAPDRLLWPVWPILLTATACGAADIVAWRPVAAGRRAARLTEIGALVLCAVLFVRWHVAQYRARSWEGRAAANARIAIAAAEAAAHLPPGLVACEFDAFVSLYTQRQAVPILPLMAADYLRERPPAEAAAQLAEILDAYHPRFLLVGTPEALDAARLLAHAPAPRIRFSGAPSSGILLYVPTSP